MADTGSTSRWSLSYDLPILDITNIVVAVGVAILTIVITIHLAHVKDSTSEIKELHAQNLQLQQEIHDFHEQQLQLLKDLVATRTNAGG